MIQPNLKDDSEARLWYFNLSGLLLAGLLGSVVGPSLEAFLWLLLARPLAALLITLLPSTTAGDFRPYLVGWSSVCLILVQFVNPHGSLFFWATMALFLLVDPSLDALLTGRCPEIECLGRAGQIMLARGAGLWVGMLANTVLFEQTGWARTLFSSLLTGLVLVGALVAERADQTGLVPRRVDDKVRLSVLADSLRSLGDRRIGWSLLLLFALALLAGALGALLFPVALLSPASMPFWLTQPANWLARMLLVAVLALCLERLSRPSLAMISYSALLVTVGIRLAVPPGPVMVIAVQTACGVAILVAYRQSLAEQTSQSSCLRATLPITAWSAGLLVGHDLAYRGFTTPVGWTVWALVAMALSGTFRGWKSSVLVTSAAVWQSDSDLKARGQGRHGDKTLDFTAAPEATRRRRTRWLSRLWHLIAIRFPVTLTLAGLTALLLAGAWHASDSKDSWKARTHGLWLKMKTELFLTSLKHRTEEELLAANRVPDNWTEFVASNFQLDGRPMKDRDFWGTPLHFDNLPQEVRIVSAGPDRKLFTLDDLERTVKKPDGIRP